MNDLIGKIFDRLTVEFRIANTRKYHCSCICGNGCDVDRGNLVSGRQRSCGCLNNEKRHMKHKDQSGNTINDVLLIERLEDEISPKGVHYIHYLCQCPFCGNLFNARYMNVKSGNTKGCGCKRYQYVKHIDLTGMDFEYCHVNKRVEDQKQPSGVARVMYQCTCTCGNEYIDWAHTIVHGRSNCGCQRMRSKGEYLVRQWLENNSIDFKPQYWFPDLRGKRNVPLFFDFAIRNENKELLCLIEYQGEQHYKEVNKSIKDFGKYQREVTDLRKKEYCKLNNIPLHEIRYDENIENACEKIMHCYENTVPSL